MRMPLDVREKSLPVVRLAYRTGWAEGGEIEVRLMRDSSAIAQASKPSVLMAIASE